MTKQLDLFPPVIMRPATLFPGLVFPFGGRSLIVRHICGSDAAAPVIVEELAESRHALRGQLALWSAAGVSRAIKK